jgi:hypothetical protein
MNQQGNREDNIQRGDDASNVIEDLTLTETEAENVKGTTAGQRLAFNDDISF